MLTLVAFVSQLVPLLLIVSAALVGSRVIHDRIAATRSALANSLIIALFALALAFAVPISVRMSTLLGAELAFSNGDWPVCIARFQLYQKWGGELNPRTSYQFGVALLESGRPQEAMPHFLMATKDPIGTVAREARFFLGVALFRLGRWSEASLVLRSIRGNFAYATFRDYLIGRSITRSHGDLRQAERFFIAALERDPEFGPALYHLVRLQILRGDPPAALQSIERFTRHKPVLRNDPFIKSLQGASSSGATLPDEDFIR